MRSFIRWRSWAALLPILFVAACYPAPSPGPTPLHEAAKYEWLIGERRYSEPIDAWVTNKTLERFLLKTYITGGLDALKSQYGFDCNPRAIVPPCDNCQVCRMALSISPSGAHLAGGAPRDLGPMLIQLDIGPGSDSFRAMTYWGRSPLKNGT